MAHKIGEQIEPTQICLWLFLLSILSFTLLFASLFFTNSLSKPPLISCLTNKENLPIDQIQTSSFSCDRTDYHSDICFMSGDVRTHSPSSSILLYPSFNHSNFEIKEEKIRPYTRKWEIPLMKTIDELSLRTALPKESQYHKCDVKHDVPALVFSAAGYTGNLFHAFNNGILPLYITSQHLNKRVVFVVLKYREWWHQKYEEILAQLSDYPIVDFRNDNRTHCFPGAIVGLRFHETLYINPERLRDHKSTLDFRNLLTTAYETNKKGIEKRSKTKRNRLLKKLVIISREGTRVIKNERAVVRMAKKLGFEATVLRPTDSMPLKDIYDVLSSCDVALGVHGAALSQILFMKPGSTLIQIIPVGTEDLSWSCFGEPALKMGMKYIGYRIDKRESSLFRKYGENIIVKNPDVGKINMGWQRVKEVYLGQNVTLNLKRVREMLIKVR